VATRLAGALPRRFREPGIRGHQALAGWTFIAPVIVILGLFLVVPIAMAAWVSVSDWTGNGSPLGANAHWVGLANYRQLLTTPGLDQSNFGTAMRNNFYYVLLVVPIQTAVSLFLAVIVNRAVKGVGFFRTAFYFPSVTSSVAITVLFLFLFAVDGPVNKVVSWFGATGPAWFYDPDGLFHLILAQFGVSQSNPPHALANSFFLGISYWDWLAGPSVAMRLHHHGDLHDLRDVHAALPRRAPGHRRVGQRSGGARRRFGVEEVPVRHRADDPAGDLHGRDARADRDVADLRPDIRRHEGAAGQHDAHPGVPVLQRVLQQQRVGRRRGPRVHPLRGHRLDDAPDAALDA